MPEHLPHNQETKDLNQDVSAEVRLGRTEAEAVEALAERLNLKEQYRAQVKVLSQSGLLEMYFEDSEPKLGIVGIDGQKYALPSYQDLLKRLEDPEKRKLLEIKAEQGFTKLLLVPFAMPLSVLINRFKDILLKTHKETGIKATDGTKLELNTEDPLYVWDDLKKVEDPKIPENEQKQIEYGVTDYDGQNQQERGGHYKLRNSDGTLNSDQAWQILLIENNPDLPAQGKGQDHRRKKTTRG
jgi:hypothetical protein